jgi:virulence-associated protein VapD
MSATATPLPEPQSRQGFPRSFKRSSTTYALAIDVEVAALDTAGDPYNNAYQKIRRVLARHGFTWQQGSVYFGGEAVTAVTCVLAAQDLVATLPWFAASVRDVRMLRIEEMNDLKGLGPSVRSRAKSESS